MASFECSVGDDNDKWECIAALLLYAVLAARQGRIIVVSTPTDYEGQNWESVGAIHARARIVLQTLTFGKIHESQRFAADIIQIMLPSLLST